MSRIPDDPRPPRTRRPPTRPTEGDEPAEGGPSVFRPAQKKKSAPSDTRGVRNYGKGEAPGLWERILYGSVGSAQLAVFCRQFAAYLDAGVDIQKALKSLGEQFQGTALGPVMNRLEIAIRRGSTLTDAARNEPQAFDAFFLSMLRVAEARGGVPETLRDLARHYDARLRLIRQARSAMIYPIAVIVIASAVIAFLTVWILPLMAEFISELAGRGAELPLPSRVLMAFSRFVRSVGWIVIPCVMIGVPILLLRTYRTAAGKAVMDPIAMRTPVLGGILRKLDVARFSRTISTLLAAGVDMKASLELTSEVVQLDPLRKALRTAQEKVMQGSELSDAMDRTRRFTPDVIAIINSGEETGKLPESLEHLANDYEEQVNHAVKNLGQLVQPLLMIFMGGIVLFIILAVFLPYLQMLTSAAQP